MYPHPRSCYHVHSPAFWPYLPFFCWWCWRIHKLILLRFYYWDENKMHGDSSLEFSINDMETEAEPTLNVVWNNPELTQRCSESAKAELICFCLRGRQSPCELEWVSSSLQSDPDGSLTPVSFCWLSKWMWGRVARQPTWRDSMFPVPWAEGADRIVLTLTATCSAL